VPSSPGVRSRVGVTTSVVPNEKGLMSPLLSPDTLKTISPPTRNVAGVPLNVVKCGRARTATRLVDAFAMLTL